MNIPDAKINCPIIIPIDPQEEGYLYHECGCDRCEYNGKYINPETEEAFNEYELEGHCFSPCRVEEALGGHLYYRCPTHGFVQKYVEPVKGE